MGVKSFSVVKAVSSPYCSFQNSYHWFSFGKLFFFWFPPLRMVYLLLPLLRKLSPSHSKCQTLYTPKGVVLFFSESWEQEIGIFPLGLFSLTLIPQSSLLSLSLSLIDDKYSEECGGFLIRIKYMNSVTIWPSRIHRNHVNINTGKKGKIEKSPRIKGNEVSTQPKLRCDFIGFFYSLVFYCCIPSIQFYRGPVLVWEGGQWSRIHQATFLNLLCSWKLLQESIIPRI